MLFKLVIIVFLCLGVAGVVLALNKLSGGRIPKWVLPVSIAVTIIGFNVYDEYSWYGRKTAALEGNWVIVNEHHPRVWWRPWTLVQSPVSAFLAINVDRNNPLEGEDNMFETSLYTTNLFGSATSVPLVIDCNNALFGPYLGDLFEVPWDNIPQDKVSELCPS